ncbi:unnamed protein product, partial [Allacma fusca]
NKKR